MKFCDLTLPPNSTKFAQQIDELREIYEGITLQKYFEPHQQLFFHKAKASLPNLSGHDLTAWQQSICYSGLVKMKLLEDSILTLLKNSDFFSALILLRQHMEQTGMLALAVDKLQGSIRDKKYEEFNDFITKTWFGSSFYNNPKFRDTEFAMFRTETIKISQMIGALDKYMSGEKAKELNYVFQRNYAWLCQFVHPNSSSSSMFVDNVEEENGTTIQFKWQQHLHNDLYFPRVLSNLKYSQIAGLSCFFILQSFSFNEDMTFTQNEENISFAYHEILDKYK